ncbi:MAG TPA: zinc-binding dehydrogenase [Vicinamibacterales bacterium]|nr:zinc-binding dehydrogenase [Vicinamibacterales bacterium]
MKAVRFHRHGGTDVLVYETAPDPVVRSGWAVVRVRACALNYLDLWQRRGLERVTIPMPHISGADVAGEVADVASDAPEWKTGQRVMVQPGLSCGRCPACLAGRDNYCPRYDVLGYQSAGGYAEFVAVPVQNLIALPDHIGDIEAAAFPLAFLTAWHMLQSRAHVTAGETVLVLAAGSGVGQAAVQIARLMQARVIATAGGADKIAKARELGADEVIDHYDENIVQRVRQLTTNRGVDVVVEHVGAATWEKSLKCLARGGRVVTCGATTGHETALDLRHLFARQLSVLGSYMGGKAELLRAAALFFRGRFAPVVDSTFPLADAARAQKTLESSGHFGKIVLVP